MTDTINPTLTTGVWTVDPSHSEVGFTVRHLGLSKVRGRFNSFTGSVTVAEPIEDSSLEAVIDLSSVDTNNDQRDEHLRSTDFFGIEKSSTMTFRSTRIVANGTTGTIAGELTVNGVTRNVDLDTEFYGTGVDPYGTTRAGFAASTTISRKDFGIDFNVPLDAGSLLIGDKVTVEIEVQLVPAS